MKPSSHIYPSATQGTKPPTPVLSGAQQSGSPPGPALGCGSGGPAPVDGQRGAKASVGAGRRGWLLALGLALAVLGAAGCHTSKPGSFSDLAEPGLERPDLRTLTYATNLVQEGDIVAITFQYATNFNSVQKVTLDGVLDLDQVGQVRAAGSTVTNLQAELTRLYKPYAKDDYITVKITTAAAGVYITGAVVRPGKVIMERPMTALEAIMEAGGFDPFRAKMSQVVVFRLENGEQRTYRLNLKRTMRGEDVKPFYLKPFDIVHVPTKTFNF